MKTVEFFYVPFPSVDVATHICTQLLEQRLIGCANIMPMQSIYRWKGVVTKETEVVAIIKTTVALINVVKETITQLHPYEVPCIAHASVSTNETFARWLETECLAC